MHNAVLTDWIKARSQEAELVLSACTGALLLAKAGLLDGLEATTHHGAIDLLREVRAIVADPDYFKYAQELVAAASGGRARLRGQDVLDGAQDVNMQLWMTLLNPKLYEPEGVTWENRNPYSAARNGIRGTVRAWARNKAGHFAARINKLRTGVATSHFSQLPNPDIAFDPPARPQESELEWDDLKRAIFNDL
jgi:putative intracellular protease/amidase